MDTSWLDFKLGMRMLVKHPVMTLIGVVSTSLAIGVNAAYFEVVNDFAYPALPLAAGLTFGLFSANFERTNERVWHASKTNSSGGLWRL